MNQAPLIASCFDSGFLEAHDTYNALSAASDGCIYYVLSSDQINVGGHMFRFDPLKEEIKFLGDLNVICGQASQKSIAQGKSHVLFYEFQNIHQVFYLYLTNYFLVKIFHLFVIVIHFH